MQSIWLLKSRYKVRNSNVIKSETPDKAQDFLSFMLDILNIKQSSGCLRSQH